ncbi:DUF5615 family PIN-like protein [Hymenobacter weizhouensis]|uniref:DUF5615 family PIN-like protein n=1 Tax=Hymenobacter sp. YIM 151500-1 TaxID=2987689 RepID=UPI0039B6F32C
MMKYLIDANLPHRMAFWNTPDYEQIPDLAWSDTQVWEYASQNQQTIITKDTDFVARVQQQCPPKVIRLRVGNMSRRNLWIFLQQQWPAVVHAIQQPEVCWVELWPDRLAVFPR